jgi:hypothetical protein
MRNLHLFSGLVAMVVASAAAAQPVCSEQRITTDDFGFLMSFGYTVAMSDEWILVGARGDDTNGPNAGAAYIFRPSDSRWVQTQKLLAPDGAAGDRFSDAVAIDGDVSAIGARLHFHEDNPGRGAVYIYRYNGKEWVFEQELTPPGDWFQFGARIAISGNRLVVTATFAIFVYRFDGGQWSLAQQLPPIDSVATSIAIDGDIIVVGTPADNILECDPNETANQSGGAFAFHYDRASGTWGEPIRLLPSILHCNQQLGWAIAIDGTRVIVSGQWPHAAHVFEFDAASGQWNETAMIEASFDAAFLDWGRRPTSIAIQGDTAIVGADGSFLAGPWRGAAFIFRRMASGQWMHRTTVLPELPSGSAAFGWSVSISGERAIVVAHLESNQAGAAYIYDLAPRIGDLNCDGVTNATDLLILLDAWGVGPPPGEVTHYGLPADLNYDGAVNVFDLLLLLGNWG